MYNPLNAKFEVTLGELFIAFLLVEVSRRGHSVHLLGGRFCQTVVSWTSRRKYVSKADF